MWIRHFHGYGVGPLCPPISVKLENVSGGRGGGQRGLFVGLFCFICCRWIFFNYFFSLSCLRSEEVRVRGQGVWLSSACGEEGAMRTLERVLFWGRVGWREQR